MSSDRNIVIVANRLPFRQVKRGSSIHWQRSPGGLVSALQPILQRWSSTWIGWSGVAGATAPAPFTRDNIVTRPVPISRSELDGFYEGFSNRTIWPLYHDAIRPPEYRRAWWSTYVQVNDRFARAAAETAAKGAFVWVHDYQLQLVPSMLRALRPDVRIGFFLHIPFPPQELFAQMPWRRQVLEGLLGADVVGFQTVVGAQNFAQLCRRYTEAVGEMDTLEYDGRRVRIGAFPISVDVKRLAEVAASSAVEARVRDLRDKLGPGRRILLGVDRLDYTKGIDLRLEAYHELLKSKRTSIAESVLVQVAVPSRDRVKAYRELKSHVERIVGEINGDFGELGRAPIHYLHRSLAFEELVALYRAADVMVVTPLRDGMNLVAKEYCSCRIDDTGVLLLSEFAGAAKELVAAMLVNPHDVDGLQAAMHAALGMPVEDQRRRMRVLRDVVTSNDVFHWANTFVEALTK